MNKIQFLFFALFIGCQPNVSPPEKSSELPFFDLKTFIETETGHLKTYKAATKMTAINGKEETQNISPERIREDLQIFSNADINKPAWVGKYEVDSLKNDRGELMKLSYQATSPKLKIKTLEITYKNGRVAHITIEKSASGAISTIHETLQYTPGVGYEIRRSQDVVATGKNDFHVRVLFKP
ncbi:MAG: hypothetical protein D6714_17310 [Bacteroidetes bacterium]|nr:MAG: hypothetical protein D6714_17310 [Bacteroidota bacterium]